MVYVSLGLSAQNMIQHRYMVTLEMHPINTPGIILLRRIPMRLPGRDDQEFIGIDRHSFSLNFHPAFSLYTINQHMLRNPLVPLSEMVFGPRLTTNIGHI